MTDTTTDLSRRASEEETAEKPGRPRRARRIAGRVATAAACLVVVAGFTMPNDLDGLTPSAFVRLPLEIVLGLAVVAAVPRARRAVAALLGAALGLLVIVKVIDMGFHATLDRPFHPVFDWSLFGPALEYLGQSAGRATAIGAAAGAVALAVAVLAATTLSLLRLSRPVVRHRAAAARAAVALGAVWVACAVLGARLPPGVPVAAVAFDRALQIPADLREQRRFAAQAGRDAFAHTPGEQMLTALRGKDVVFAFIESYGRDALENPTFAARVGAVLEDGNRRLRKAGFEARSAFLTSPTVGGSSWLAHATLLSGLWIDNQKRHRDLVTSDRLTLTGAFRRAKWRTVAVMPGNTKPWPEGNFYGYDKVYPRAALGYKGPPFNWDTPPDQYTLSFFERTERARRDRPPLMAEIPLVSSHSPWAPTPRLVGWDEVGDGEVFGPIAAAGQRWQDAWRTPERMRAAYRGAIEYTLAALLSYVETYGDENLVVIFVGDHQPAPVITGPDASRDVPIAIVARDRAVLERISGWGWQEGVKPGPDAPVWRMDAFRDRFLTAFGTRPRPDSPSSP